MSEVFRETRYGFQWGQVIVERDISHKGYRQLSIRTPRGEVVISVTPTGFIRTSKQRKTNRTFGPAAEA